MQNGEIEWFFATAQDGGIPRAIHLASTLLWRRLLVSHSTASRMVFGASSPGFR